MKPNLVTGDSSEAPNGRNRGSAQDSDGSLDSESSSEGSSMSIGDDGDYPTMVWDEDGSGKKGLTTLQATLSLTTAIIGAGVMALPQLPRKGGLYPCVGFSLFSAWLCYECGGSFHKANSAWNACHDKDQKLSTFEDFGSAAAGRWGALLVRIALVGWFIGLCSGYVILIGKQMVMISGMGWSYRVWVAILSPVLWVSCMLKDLTAIAKLMPVGVLAAIGCCVLMIAQAYKDIDQWKDWPEEEQSNIHSYWPEQGFMAIGSVVATLFGAFGVMGNIPSVTDEMRHPRKLPQALRLALAVVTSLYLSIMVIGYWGYGNFIQDDILVSMSQSPANFTEAFAEPPEQWTGRSHKMIPILVAWCVLINLVMSYPLNMMCVFVSIQGLDCAQPRLAPGACANYLMRTGIMGLTLLIALAIENFSVVFSLFAAVTGPVQCVFIPICFGGMIRRKIGAKQPSLPRRAFLGVIMLYAAFCLVVGTVDAMGGVIKSVGGR